MGGKGKTVHIPSHETALLFHKLHYSLQLLFFKDVEPMKQHLVLLPGFSHAVKVIGVFLAFFFTLGVV